MNVENNSSPIQELYLSVIIQNPIGYWIFVEFTVLVARPLYLRLMPHINDGSNFGSWGSETDEPFIFHKSMISWLNLPSSSIEESLFLSLCELSLCIHYR